MPSESTTTTDSPEVVVCRPARSLTLQCAVAVAGDEKLSVRLEGDVIHVGEAPDRYPRAGQTDSVDRRAVSAEDDDLRSPPALFQ